MKFVKASSWCLAKRGLCAYENHVLSEALSPLSKLGESGGESEKHLCAQHINSSLSKTFVSSYAKHVQLAQRMFTYSH